MWRPPLIHVLGRALAVWLVLLGVEFVHGVLRAIFLAPLAGDLLARQIGVIVGSVLILVVAYLFAGWLRAPDTKSLMVTGLLWLILTGAFEFLFGHFVFGRSWQSLAEDYDVRKGGLLGFGMAVLALSPWISARLRDAKSDRL